MERGQAHGGCEWRTGVEGARAVSLAQRGGRW
jgi:hypothetical protein